MINRWLLILLLTLTGVSLAKGPATQASGYFYAGPKRVEIKAAFLAVGPWKNTLNVMVFAKPLPASTRPEAVAAEANRFSGDLGKKYGDCASLVLTFEGSKNAFGSGRVSGAQLTVWTAQRMDNSSLPIAVSFEAGVKNGKEYSRTITKFNDGYKVAVKGGAQSLAVESLLAQQPKSKGSFKQWDLRHLISVSGPVLNPVNTP